MAVLEVRDLRCGYGKKKPVEIVHGVSFSVDRGEFVCVIGANGCGKTTTLKAMMGLLPCAGGEVLVEGKPLSRMPEHERARHFAYIPQAHTPQADVLVMDEPTAALDFGNQQLVLSRMSMLSRMGKAVVMVTHDPDHALFCADRVIVMDAGRVLAQGTPAECITTEMLARIYGTDARVVDVELDGGLRERVCVPVLAR